MSDKPDYQDELFTETPPPAPPEPASGPWQDWDDELYDRLNDIVDDETLATLSQSLLGFFRHDWLIMITGLLIVLLIFWGGVRVLANRSATSPSDSSSAPQEVAPPPTYTPTPLGAEAAPSPSPTPTPTPTPTPLAGIAVGARVRVANTEGQGMSFRAGPGTNYIRLATAPDGTLFKVIDGPVEAEGHDWWRLEDEDGTVGWGAAEFLELAGE